MTVVVAVVGLRTIVLAGMLMLMLIMMVLSSLLVTVMLPEFVEVALRQDRKTFGNVKYRHSTRKGSVFSVFSWSSPYLAPDAITCVLQISLPSNRSVSRP